MSVTSLEELAERAGAAVLDGHRVIVDAARALANEVDISGARARLDNALAGLAVEREKVRLASEAEREAKATLTNAEYEAEWELDDRFITQGNKTLLILDMAEDSTPITKAMTADERRAWKAAELRKLPAVTDAERNLRSAAQQAGAARDTLATAEDRFKAAVADLRAACAHLSLFAAVFSDGGTR